MARKRKDKDDEGGGIDPEAWMVTFSDLLTLLLTFFVLLLSMSSMDNKALRTMFAAFLGAADVLEFAEESTIEPYYFIETIDVSPSEISKLLDKIMNRYLMGELDHQLKRTLVNVTDVKNSIFITFPSLILFKSGGFNIRKELESPLKEFISVVKNSNYSIRIEGHTDDVAAKNNDEHLNWKISSLRAASIMKFFIKENISPERITSVGLGKYKPLFPNDSEENREKNRRVEIILDKPLKKT